MPRKGQRKQIPTADRVISQSFVITAKDKLILNAAAMKLGIQISELLRLMIRELHIEAIPDGTPLTKVQEQYVKQSVRRLVRRIKEQTSEESYEERADNNARYTRRRQGLETPLDAARMRMPEVAAKSEMGGLLEKRERERNENDVCYCYTTKLSGTGNAQVSTAAVIPRTLIVRACNMLGVATTRELLAAYRLQWIFGDDFDDIVLRFVPAAEQSS